jgi:hypothetical protein
MEKGQNQNHVVSIIVLAILALATLLYRSLQTTVSVGQSAVLILIVLLLYITLLSIYNFYHAKPNEIKNNFEELHKRISLTVDTLIRKQQFIEQQTLNLIEEQAQNIWVITTKLENEIKDPGLRETVKKNLQNGKRYTYFLPAPDHPYFKTIERSMEQYKEFEFYDAFQTQVRFIRLPIDTQFLLEEVVIYNPEKPEIKDNINGINGFTYYESRDDNSDRTLHMKIEGYLLRFLCEQLNDFLRNKGLKNAAERIITEYKLELNDRQKVYLADLLDERSIRDEAKYSEFIESFGNRNSASLVGKILQEYKEKR